MQQIIYFIKKFRYFLLFIFLEIIALVLTVQQHSFHASKFVSSANTISGFLFEKKSSISDFFLLKTENRLLNDENVRLKNLLQSFNVEDDSLNLLMVISPEFNQQYHYVTGKVINNNFRKRNNYLTINKGIKHGLKPDMGVINGSGILGVIKNVSTNYATVLSILNTNSRINVRLKNSQHFGTLIWDGKDYSLSQIIDIPRQAQIKKGDTIISGGRSAIFPEGILIGTVNNFDVVNNQYQNINILLFNDMSALGQIQIVNNLLKAEQTELEIKTNNE